MNWFKNLRVSIRLVLVVFVMLAFAWTAMIVWVAREQERVAAVLSQDLAGSVNQMTMAQLLFMKITKTMEKRALYYEQVQESLGVKHLRVIRGAAVTTEMGESDDPGAELTDELERRAIDSAQPVYQVVTRDGGSVLKTVIPSIASRNYLGKDCMECHDAKEGDVLGAVSMEISLDRVNAEVRASTIQVVIAALVLTALVMAVIALYVHRCVSRPMITMTAGLCDIAQGDGDLTRRLPVRSEDEIGQAADAFNRMMDKLQPLMASVHDSAVQVTAQAEALASESARIEQASLTQSEQTATVAAAVVEMVGSVAGVARGSEEVKTLSERSCATTVKGSSSMQNLAARLHDVEHAVGRITAQVSEFVERTQSISSMTQQVKEIANQTNLLALNAAIEAARAGEAGRGFAVVADEVRKLAEKSATSAAQIDAITGALAGDSEAVKRAIDTGLAALQSSHASMEEVSAVLDEARAAAQDASTGMISISAATVAQHQTSTFIAGKVESIAELAERSRQALSETSAAARRMAALAQALQAEMSKFKI